jgi:hypothetical protein
VLYLLLILVLGTLIYVGWRAARSQTSGVEAGVVGPHHDPDFLRRLGHGDNPH